MWPDRSKGKTLEFLSSRLRLFTVPRLLLIPFDSWASKPESLLDEIQALFGDNRLAVRSSFSDEDGNSHAQAGEYESVLNVSATNREAVLAAISRVAESYLRKHDSVAGEEVIVQEMVNDVVLSGVCLTHELNSGAPYYVVNYDDQTRTTVGVTSGVGEHANRTLYVHRGAASALRSTRFRLLIDAISELEKSLESDFLDIEFAMNEASQPFLLQARPITTKPSWSRGLSKRIEPELDGIQQFVRERFKPQRGVYGKTTIFGQMADWNPAEMIGRAPRALSHSIYRKLITDKSWRVAREEMGYSVPIGQPLMVSLAGQPFVDIRLSFHSYLPSSLPKGIATKLVNEWVQRLADKPELHDKIEFDVSLTCFSFDIDERLRTLARGLNQKEQGRYRYALRDLTLPLIRGDTNASIGCALGRVEKLATSDSFEPSGNLSCLFQMIENCTTLGTIPFAILARHAFIAKTLLLSLVSRDVFSNDDIGLFQASISTVAGQMLADIGSVQHGALAHESFLDRYGHLRPGTYDILSPRYDQMDSMSETLSRRRETSHKSANAFVLTPQQRRALDSVLTAESFGEISADDLLDYCSRAVAGREYAKFVFTRSVSAMLEIISTYGESHGLSREEISHIPLEVFLELGQTSNPPIVADKLRSVSTQNAASHEITSAVRLPQVLFDEAGVRIIPFQVSQPNFVTSKSVSAPTVHLRLGEPVADLKNKIVLIENADPGYDWIFAHSIAGLVTKYGGANSHMAIRCAEFVIPAAIGCGEHRFNSLTQTGHITFDCSIGFISSTH